MDMHTDLKRLSCKRLMVLPACAAMATLRSFGAYAQALNPRAQDLHNLHLKSDGIELEFPPLAETGFSVPLRAQIIAPSELKVVGIEVYLPENPVTQALKLRVLEPQNRYQFSTRLRLATSQDVWVLAILSDGSRRAARAHTVVTISACVDGS